MTASVLYDAPGPSAKRRVLISSIFAGLILLGVLAFVGYQLNKRDQFAEEKWGPLINPGNENFVPVWTLLAEALVNTLLAAGLAVLFSLVLGTLLAITRITANRWYRWLVVGLIELLRGIPVVLAIFFAARVLPEFGVNISLLWYLVIGLTAYNMVIIAEIVRAGINSLPKGQREAADSLGMTRGQVLRLILLPQAFRAMLPALISQLVVVLKDTSLGFIISYEETVRVAGYIIQNLDNPIQVYFILAVIFIVVNYALGKLAEYVERRLSRSRKSADESPVHADEMVGAGATGTGA
ncbi:amino acid ABC transporter permease [Actinokineospora sp. NPDC004072]